MPLATDLEPQGCQQPRISGSRLLNRGCRATVRKHKCPRAVGALDLSVLEARLAVQRCVLVTDHRRDRDFGAKHRFIGNAKVVGRGAHVWKHRFGDIEKIEHRGVPLQVVEVQQHGPGRVRGIGRVHRAVGQAPQQPCIDGAEAELASVGPFLAVRDSCQQPHELRGAEVGIDYQPCDLPDVPRMLTPADVATYVSGPPVLPDDRIGDGPACRSLPDDRRLSLIRNADCRDIAGGKSCATDGLFGDAHRGLGYLNRIVLDPARLGEML